MNDSIKQLLQKNHRQLVLNILKRSVIIGCIVACTLTLCLNIFYIMNGFAAPNEFFFFAAIAFIVIVALHAYLYWVSENDAYKVTDQKYNLQDSLLSYIGFQNKGNTAGIYQLQEEKLLKDIEKVQDKSLASTPPKNLIIIATLLLVCLIFSGFIPESDFIKEKRLAEEILNKITKAQTSEIKELLQKLEDEMTDEEKELLKKSALAEKVKNLEASNDKEDALRKLSEVEQEIKKEMNDDNYQKDLSAISKLANEAKQFNETKKFGEALEIKEFKNAADELEKIDFQEKDLDNLAKEIGDKKELTKEEKEKLKERLQNQIENAKKNSKSLKNSLKKSLSKISDRNSGISKDMQELSEELDDLEEDLDDLNDEDLSELSEEEIKELLKKCEKCKNKGGQCKSKKLKLSKSLKDLDTKFKFFSKMNDLKNKINESQYYVISQQQNETGKMAGKGTDDRKSDEKQEKKDNGQYSKLSGQKGDGKSLITTEETSSGKGVSKVQGKSEKSEYKTQAESFLNREDIPEELKGGVKNYFQSIHTNESEKKENK